ncbi:hypothetical protein [Microbacterium aurantiacum]|uniref:hypothetical protein n=1 Tax=Microbacterium aurantiacum TaxID=162393 RepID=UPI001F2D1329|nr:hypothetical protein [Microbacterium aurantiacum]
MGATSRSGSARWLAIALTGVLAVGVGVLAVAAYQHANPDLSDLAAEPAPTFDLGVETAEPTPEVTQTAEAIARSEERFFAIGEGAWWRATAGSCGTTEPLLERSTDAGASWTDVTPRYRNIGQIASLDPLAGTEAEMVSSMGEACETQALRTYTQGTYWDSYPDVLPAIRYIDPLDPAVVHIGGGQTTDAPCANPVGLRASGDVVALICDGTPHRWIDGSWQPVEVAGATALAATPPSLLVAHTDAACPGLAITEVADTTALVGCLPEADPAAPLAITRDGEAIRAWSGDAVSEVAAP